MTAQPIYCFRGGIGDELLLSVVAREIHRRVGRAVPILAEFPELFHGNPHVSPIIPYRRVLHGWHRLVTRRLCQLAYTEYLPQTDSNLIPPAHIVTIMCVAAGLRGSIEIKPEIYLAAPQDHQPYGERPVICIHSSGGSSKYPIANKEWYPDRFQAVVDALRDEVDFVQLGSLRDPMLAGVKDLRGQTRIRESAAILAKARLFVGLQGFLMHLARAVSCPSVIIYGGRESPEQSGYQCFTNLTSTVPCSPCWQWTRCDYHRKCMQDIHPEQVIAAIRAHLSVPSPFPLPVDRVEITADLAAMIQTFLRGAFAKTPHLLRGLQ
jgi:hypothetical protein